MDLFDIFSIVLVLTAGFSYLNHRFIGLPVSIGVMAVALTFSLALIVLEAFGITFSGWFEHWVRAIRFEDTILHGMLSFLLFAGAIHFDINELASKKWSILMLASLGTVISTGLVGGLLWGAVHLFAIDLPFVYCLLFGALISPTDPIAVMGILKTSGVPKSLASSIIGESMFNDGLALVTFTVILGFTPAREALSASQISLLVVQEALGGALFGAALGYLANTMLRTVHNSQVESLITVAVVTGGHSLAEALHVSGPIAIVMAGLLIGNHSQTFGRTPEDRQQVDVFWEVIDEILNSVLFGLIGLEVLVLSFTVEEIVTGLLAIPVVVAARFVAVGVLVHAMRRGQPPPAGAITIMTWGGIRGGVSVALALSLPQSEQREMILAITYAVVVFSILVQGLTIEKLIQYKHGYRSTHNAPY